MRTGIVGAFLIAAMATGPTAFAKDRMDRARAIYATNCEACHGLEHENRQRDLGKGRVNLAGEGRKLRDKKLREWLDAKPEERDAPHCDITKLDPVQRELMMAFLETFSKPTSRTVGAVPASPTKPQEPPPPPPPSGQGDRR